MSIEMKVACEQCGRFDAEFADPTFDIARLPKVARDGARPLNICELCAKTNIETEMMRLSAVIH